MDRLDNHANLGTLNMQRTIAQAYNGVYWSQSTIFASQTSFCCLPYWEPIHLFNSKWAFLLIQTCVSLHLLLLKIMLQVVLSLKVALWTLSLLSSSRRQWQHTVPPPHLFNVSLCPQCHCLKKLIKGSEDTEEGTAEKSNQLLLPSNQPEFNNLKCFISHQRPVQSAGRDWT